jgi:WD40 repeat protein
VTTGESLAVLHGPNDGVTALAFSPDGRWLASATGRLADGGDKDLDHKFVDVGSLPAEIDLWDIEAQKVVATLTGHKRSILSLAFSPDGRTLASGSADFTARLWDVGSGKMEANLTGFSGPVTAVAISPDGKTLATGGGDFWSKSSELKFWDLVSHQGKKTLKGHNGPVFTVAFSPDGRTFASAGMDRIVRLWDVATGDEVRTIRGHKAAIWSLAFDPKSERIATASWDQTVKVWDAAQPQGPVKLPSAGNSSGCFSPDCKYLIRGGRHLEVFEIGAGKAPFTIPDYGTDDIVLAISPDGLTLASAGTDGIVTLWEVGTWRRLSTLRGHTGEYWWTREIWCLAFSPDGRFVASGGGDETVRLWDVNERRERTVLHPGIGEVGALVFTPDGRTLIAGGPQKIVFLDTATGQRLTSLEGTAQGLALTPDGRYLAAVRTGLELIDLRTMEAKWLIKPHPESAIWSASFSPDGRTMATASWDGSAKLWNVASGQEMFTYRAPGVVWSVAFSPDGKWWTVGSGGNGPGQRVEVALFRGDTVPAAVPAELATSNAPNIAAQPISQTVTDSQPSTVMLGVFATGTPPLSYQWRKDGRDLPGQTNPALTITNVTGATAGDYRVVVTNKLGSVASSDATIGVLHVREVPIAEVNFQDKQPSAGYSAFAFSENRVTLTTNIAEIAGAGVGGGAGLVMTADGSGFRANMNQKYAGFVAKVAVLANSADGVNTTNLNLYKLYATVRTTGCTGKDSHGKVQWQFVTPDGVILTVDLDATFTS